MAKDLLSDSKIKAAKPKEKDYTLSDGEGLQLRVSVQRSKLWVFKYYRPADKTRTNMSFGSYPEVPLAKARELRQGARSLLAQGIDPKAHRDEQAQAAADQQAANSATFVVVN